MHNDRIELIKYYLIKALIASVFFVIVYFTCNYLASQREQVFHFNLAWEKNIPLVPDMIYAYISIQLLFLLPMFLLKSKQEIDALMHAFLVVTTIAGVVFLIFPASLAFSRLEVEIIDHQLFQWLFKLDLPYNTMPSLHISYSTLFCFVCFSYLKPVGKIIISLWLLLMCICVLLTHQHHVIDVFSGALLGSLVFHYVYKPKSRVKIRH